ncbi:FAD/FMN-containing dehydrogenase [Nocardia transvalensis]|uniref:Delta(24)-sterol reductase n=1 Tax=Nocardia transvalensis TaxID=37333 RepID=A0A7W9PA88_9NOCA|nr:FAD-binding oxidoreductase [Nocardia transvalensis]MBB5912053.1 FAD/FMN-containing dehydrogenase [Nocardia transvalensis]
MADTPSDIALARHRRDAADLRAEFQALPADEPVHLIKPTSNLWRPRRRRGIGLDVRRFDRVLTVDPHARVAEVEGMATYETIADATLAQQSLPPLVLDCKTITLGGAVVGTGAESSSFRAGLPHDCVTEMEILTGDGRLVTATADNEHAALFHAFPHSYGCLGYALRLRIDLQPAQQLVRLRHVRLESADEWVAALLKIVETREFDGSTVDFVDGTYFGSDEVTLSLGTFTNTAPYLSDYTGQRVYYHAVRSHTEDFLSTRDYLWRWDTDLYWTSKAFGLENRVVRWLWPQRYRNAETFRRLQMRARQSGYLDRALTAVGRPVEWVLQDADLPAETVPEFLRFFDREIGISPVWLCPFIMRRPATLYPIEPGRLFVSVGFWAPVRRRSGQSPDHHNRLIERKITELGGRKPLYSTAHYPEEEFWELYGGDTFRTLKATYDPSGRFPDLYDKCVRGR